MGRRDRNDGRAGCGVAIFAFAEMAESVTLVENCQDAERLWCVVHSDHGPISICASYRPPVPGEISSITSSKAEWENMRESCVGTIALGNMNVHSRRWLAFSSGESGEGTALAQACRDLGARQVVTEPTRAGNLLDLVLTDVDDVKARVVPGISDHDIALASLELGVPEQETVERTVWQFSEADWERLVDELGEIDWSFIDTMPVSNAAQLLTKKIPRESARLHSRANLRRAQDFTPMVDFKSCGCR